MESTPLKLEETVRCPFCSGGAMRLEVKAPNMMRVTCRICCAEGPFAHTRELALEKWNIRMNTAIDSPQEDLPNWPALIQIYIKQMAPSRQPPQAGSSKDADRSNP